MLVYGERPAGKEPLAVARTELALDERRARDARAAVEVALGQWGHHAAVDPVGLCASELATDLGALEPTRLQLELYDEVSCVVGRIVVEGAARSFHEAVRAGSVDVARSIEVVERTASLWGVARGVATETVWFEVTC